MFSQSSDVGERHDGVGIAPTFKGIGRHGFRCSETAPPHHLNIKDRKNDTERVYRQPEGQGFCNLSRIA